MLDEFDGYKIHHLSDATNSLLPGELRFNITTIISVMIVIYSLFAAVWVYFTAIGGFQSFQRLRKIYRLNLNRNSTPNSFSRRRSSSENAELVAATKVDYPEHSDDAESESDATLVTAPQQQQQQQETATFAKYATLPPPRKKRIIVAMTGATGAILGIRLLEQLRAMDIETHLIISRWAAATIAYETTYKLHDVQKLATKCYAANDVSAPISSGSFKTDGMIVVPCSMKTLAAIAVGYGDDLITRAADVIFKERRKMVLVARECPLSGIHLENMLKVTREGAIIFPPVPAFYTRPQGVEDIVRQSVGRILDCVDVDVGGFERWSGMKKFGDRE